MSLALECLSLGCLLALCAVSFSLIYSVLRITNFALQAQISVAAYVCYYLHVHLGIGAATAILLAILLGGLFGVAQYFVVFRRMLGSPSESIVIASLGVSLIIEAIILLLAGSRTLSLGMSDDVVTLGTQRLYVRDIGLFSLLVISVPLLVLFLKKGSYGLMARAIPTNLRQLLVWGRPVDGPVALVFFLAYALSSAAGVFIGVGWEVSPAMGFKWGLWSFGVAVVGGLGSVYGAVAGAAIFSIPLVLAYRFSGALFADAALFVGMTIVLLVSPAGLLPLRLRRF